MPLPRSQRLVLAGAAIEGLPLTPEDFFVLSRVSGSASTAELQSLTGLDADSTERVVGHLIELGVLRLAVDGEGPPAAPQRNAEGRNELREQARIRASQRLGQQFQRARAMTPSGSLAETPTPPGTEEKVAEDVRSPLQRLLAPVRESDPRLDASIAIPLVEQRALLALYDHVDELSHFDLLDLAPTDDMKLVRRAYHTISRRLHPDTYYKKNIGSFGELLSELFQRARTSYEVLSDDDSRDAYVDRLLAGKRRQDDERLRREADVAKRAELEAAMEVERRGLAEQNQRRAREQRDVARRNRTLARVAGTDRRAERAAQLVREGMAEREAGRQGAAAGLFRLAIDLRPDDDELHVLWQASLGVARQQRADRAFDLGMRCVAGGQIQDGAKFLAEAAEANPTPRNLAEAAAAMAEVDPSRSRTLALSALDALVAFGRLGGADPTVSYRVHCCASRAFLAANQRHSARAEAEKALALKPGDAAALSLLNAAKVT